MIQEFIEESKKEIKDRKDYCILVYSTLSPLNKDLKLAYSSISEFEEKVENDIRHNNIMFDIEFKVLFFN